MTSPTTGIRLEGVVASRPTSSFTLRVADLQVAPGEFVALTGESGSGKSTLLDVTAGLLVAREGVIRVAGLDLRKPTARRRVRRVGTYLAQQGTVIDHLTVRENLELSAAIVGMKHDPARLDAAVDEMGLGEWRETPARQLSGGQRQRVAIAAALYRRSPVVWADEPTSALDEENAARVFGALRGLAKEHGAAVLCVTHDLHGISGWADHSTAVTDGHCAQAA